MRKESFYGNSKQNDMCSKCFNDGVKEKKEKKRRKRENKKVESISETNANTTNTNATNTDTTTTITTATTTSDFTFPEKKEKLKCAFDECSKKLASFSYKCKCQGDFCVKHRHSFDHNCTFINDNSKLRETLLEQACKPEKVKKF